MTVHAKTKVKERKQEESIQEVPRERRWLPARCACTPNTQISRYVSIHRQVLNQACRLYPVSVMVSVVRYLKLWYL